MGALDGKVIAIMSGGHGTNRSGRPRPVAGSGAGSTVAFASPGVSSVHSRAGDLGHSDLDP